MTSIIYADDTELQWTHPDRPGGGMPGSLNIPIRIRPGYDQSEPDMIAAMQLHVSIAPWVYQPHTHWANQHYLTYQELFGTLWHNDGVKPMRGMEEFIGSERLGYRGQAKIPPDPTGPSGGWGRIAVQVERHAGPVAADGILAWIRVRSGHWKPSMHLIATDAGPTIEARTRIWDAEGSEIAVIHEPHYVLVWDDQWYPYRRKDLVAQLPTISANIDGHVRPIERTIVPYERRPKIEYQE